MLFIKPDEDKNPKKLKEKLVKREGENIEAIEEIDNLKDEVLKLSIQLIEKVEESKENDKNADLLNESLKRGIIDSEGNLID